MSANCSEAAGRALGNESAAFVSFSVGLALVDATIICGNTLVILAVLTSESLRSVTSLLITSLAVADLLVGVLVLPFSIAHEVGGDSQRTSESLRSVTSLLITSLAVADLLVGVLVLPFSIAHEVLGQVWVFGPVWCQVWLAVDVWMCTASIYNLVVISIERYVAILKPLHYQIIVTPTRGKLAVLGAWMLSFSISFPPMVFNWSSAFASTPDCTCSPLDNSPGYIAYSSTGSFFLPMAIIIFVYIRIYGVVRRVAAEDRAQAMELRETTPMVPDAIASPPLRTSPPTLDSPAPSKVLVNHVRSGSSDSAAGSVGHIRFSFPEAHDGGARQLNGLAGAPRRAVLVRTETNGSSAGLRQSTSPPLLRSPPLALGSPPLGDSTDPPPPDIIANHRLNPLNAFRRSSPSGFTLNSSPSAFSIRERFFPSSRAAKAQPDAQSLRNGERSSGGQRARRAARMSSELKAVKMVAIVTGVFIACWLGFSIIYVLRAMPFCRTDDADCIPPTVFSIFFWLGYTNSALNPVLYAVFNRQFRRAFRKLLTCSTGH